MLNLSNSDYIIMALCYIMLWMYFSYQVTTLLISFTKFIIKHLKWFVSFVKNMLIALKSKYHFLY